MVIGRQGLLELCHTSDSQGTDPMPKARRVGHRRRRPSAYEQAGLAKVTGDGTFLRNVSIFGTAFKGVVACNKSSTRLIAASKPLRLLIIEYMRTTYAYAHRHVR